MTKLLILDSQIDWVQTRNRDDIGKVFFYNGGIYRAIYPSKEQIVLEMLDSGFISELVSKDLFPQTTIANYRLNNFDLVLKHKKISPTIYPQEWTFSMLKNAALMVIEIAVIARRYGYNMKDCHSLNVLYEGVQPQYVDLGSFHPNSNFVTGWQPYIEFLRCYYYPLYLWSSGKHFISKLAIFSGNLMPVYEHYIYKYRLLGLLPKRVVEALIKIRFAPYQISINNRIASQIHSRSSLLTYLLAPLKMLVDFSNNRNIDLYNLANRIKSMNIKAQKTLWSNYHLEATQKMNRFGLIIESINTHCNDAHSCIDVAGNQGVFSQMMLTETNVQQVIVQDLDQDALNTGYCKVVRNHVDKKNITFANYNAFAPLLKLGQPVPSSRLKVDMVVCLALLHHLVFQTHLGN